jgi:aminoglycoside phosphotransferase (APT) family kinase protein
MVVRRPNEKQLRQNPHAAADEFKLLQIMKALGLATPTPYHCDSSGVIFPTPYLVIAYIEGVMEFSPANLDDYVLQLATQLAQIHRIDCSQLDLAFLPPITPRFTAQLSTRPAMVNTSLAEARLRETLEAVWPLPQQNVSALLHGDYWPGNVLWQDRQLMAVIDWEDAALGDPLADFAISRLDSLWIFGLPAFNSFTQHYQSLLDIDYTHLPYWDLCAALRLVRLAGADLIDWAAFFPPFGRPDITASTIREHYQFFITQAFEKLATRNHAHIAAASGFHYRTN